MGIATRYIFIEEGMQSAPSQESHAFICKDEIEVKQFLAITPKGKLYWNVEQSGELMGRWRAVLVKD